jgi:hypothetical protein
LLAQQIQAEEDNHAQMLRDAFKERQRQKELAQQEAEERRKNKKSKGCVIM